jgi:hypothetical protein
VYLSGKEEEEESQTPAEFITILPQELFPLYSLTKSCKIPEPLSK